MKESSLFITTTLISLIFLSCSNNQSLKISYHDSETLKDTLKEKEEDTKWASELEGNRLSEKLNIDTKIVSKDVKKDNQLVKILKDYQKPVYAQINQFGSLDDSSLNSSQKKFINDFMSFVSASYNQDASSFFIPEYYFNYNFFVNDLKNNWKDHFQTDFPSSGEENKSSEIFLRWISGEPVKYENQMIIPVRAYVKKGYVNLLLFTNNDVTIKLYNVQVETWGNEWEQIN